MVEASVIYFINLSSIWYFKLIINILFNNFNLNIILDYFTIIFTTVAIFISHYTELNMLNSKEILFI